MELIRVSLSEHQHKWRKCRKEFFSSFHMNVPKQVVVNSVGKTSAILRYNLNSRYFHQHHVRFSAVRL